MNSTSVKAKLSFLRNLDATIARFGDSHALFDNGKTKNHMKEENKVNVIIEENILKRFSPPGLEEPFRQLYAIIFPTLFRASNKVGSPLKKRKNDHASDVTIPRIPSLPISPSSLKLITPSSSAAILMGVKGSGKTLLLERVLAACREQLQTCGRRIYRMVEINGIVCRGEDVASVIYEIIQQLSGIAYRSIQMTKRSKSVFESSTSDSPEKNDKPAERISSSGSIFTKNTSSEDRENKIHKSRARGINENQAGGDNTYDDDKTVIVWKDDGKNDRKRKRKYWKRKQQKIEKHMLRLRQATFNSNLALLESILKLASMDEIPILLTLDELDSFTDNGERQMLLYHFLDRVATSGSNLILVGMTSSFSTLTLLEKRIRSRAEGSAKIIYLRTPPTYYAFLELLEYKLEGCVVCKDVFDNIAPPKGSETIVNVSAFVQKPCTQGANRKEDYESIERTIKISNAMEREFRFGRDIRWFSRVIATSLVLYRDDCIVQMSRDFSRTIECDPIGDIPLSYNVRHMWDAIVMMGASTFGTTASLRQPDICVNGDIMVSPRLQALLDLPTPQVALLLSARRILKREEHRDQAVLAPLTLERIIREYESFRRNSMSMGNSKLLKRAVHPLMQEGLLVPSIDHSGGGPLHYNVTKIYRNMDFYTLSRLPLHIPINIERELGYALEQNMMECPTALKEWGKYSF